MSIDKDEAKDLRDILNNRAPAGTEHKLTPEQRTALVREFIADPTRSIASLGRHWGVSPAAVRYLLRSRAGL